MTVIGLTGGSGAGKTSALRVLREMGVCVIDCDEVYHRLLETSDALLGELEVRFPGTVRDGRLDRKKLAGVVFSDPEELRALNGITHRYVRRETEERLRAASAQGCAAAAIDAAALIQSGMNDLCDVVVGVTAPREAKAARIMARDALTSRRAAERLDAQPDDAYYQKNCDFVLVNDYPDEAGFAKYCREFFSGVIGRNTNG